MLKHLIHSGILILCSDLKFSRREFRMSLWEFYPRWFLFSVGLPCQWPKMRIIILKRSSNLSPARWSMVWKIRHAVFGSHRQEKMLQERLRYYQQKVQFQAKEIQYHLIRLFSTYFCLLVIFFFAIVSLSVFFQQFRYSVVTQSRLHKHEY